MGSDHGVVVCRLCQRHGKANNFAGEGYRCARPVAVLLAFALCAQISVLCSQAQPVPRSASGRPAHLTWRAPARARQEGQAQRAGGPHDEEQGAQGAGGRDGDRPEARDAGRGRRAAPARQGRRRDGCALCKYCCLHLAVVVESGFSVSFEHSLRLRGRCCDAHWPGVGELVLVTYVLQTRQTHGCLDVGWQVRQGALGWRAPAVWATRAARSWSPMWTTTRPPSALPALPAPTAPRLLHNSISALVCF